MTSQPVPNETMIVLPSNVINFSQAEKAEPTNQGQGSLKKRLQAEVKVIGTIQILCGVMVLSLGIMLASASFSPNFTQVTSTLLNSAYPFIGPFFVSRVSEEGRMGRRREEDDNSLDFPPATLLCLICQEQGVNSEACSPVRQ
uniref:Membrane spanning 4-domains A6A n=1 Tax=Mandrillus leucophaeus TaxID=9568 RepID=A0A2K5YBX7_MANLE